MSVPLEVELEAVRRRLVDADAELAGEYVVYLLNGGEAVVGFLSGSRHANTPFRQHPPQCTQSIATVQLIGNREHTLFAHIPSPHFPPICLPCPRNPHNSALQRCHSIGADADSDPCCSVRGNPHPAP